MNPLHSRTLLRILAALAILVFVGDLAVDAAADLRGDHCASSMSDSSPAHEKAPCSHCSCAMHVGAVVVADFATPVDVNLHSTGFLLIEKEASPTRLAGSIDHPPELI